MLDVCAAPEIMTYAKSLGSQAAAGFIYISASHNPIGHNGLKFGLTDGGVLPGPQVNILINDLKTLLGSRKMISYLENALKETDSGLLSAAYSGLSQYKKDALSTYKRFTRAVITDFSCDNEAEEVLNVIKEGLKNYPLGICADFNGSARTVSIDREFLESLGAGFKSINDKPGEICHRIVPEGESLIPCVEFLESCHGVDPSFTLGYVPDCDGDRGNLVIWDKNRGKARPIDAQEVFALSCAAELAYLAWTDRLKAKTALAVNGATSLRVDRIAETFGIKVFRAETGEANVVGLARRLREDGFLVRILGEGSNGGNITHPAAVRDPLNTLLAIIKLLTIRSSHHGGSSKKGLFEIWCDKSGQMELYRQDFTLGNIIASLPAFNTTSVVSDNGVLKINSVDHGALKDRYQGIFLRDWEERKNELYSKYGIAGWDAEAFNGSEERQGLKNFGESGSGGLKIGFINDEGRKIACLWMRGSATEPLFRVMADTEGPDHDFEQDLIKWQRRMLTEADNMC